jgi:hypothetical protein
VSMGAVVYGTCADELAGLLVSGQFAAGPDGCAPAHREGPA